METVRLAAEKFLAAGLGKGCLETARIAVEKFSIK